MTSPKTPNPTRRRRRLGPWKARLALLVFSLLVSALVLGAVEGACRIAGYGGYPPTFAKVGVLDDGSSLVMTQQTGPGSYFFATRSRAGSLNETALVMPKPAGTVRIVVVGGSAAEGSPWSRHLAASSFLQAMLSDCWPEREVEVINLGTTAIASFPVLGIATESLRYDPDLVVAYLGNNEFYGAYGVASLHSAGRTPAMIRLIRAVRSLGIAQFIDDHRKGYDTSDPRTLMEAMVGRATIGPDDPARDDAARNLGAFVGDLIDRCRSRGVPVIVCPPPCNERGLAPLGAPDRSAIDPAQRILLEAALAAAQNALEHDDPAASRDFAVGAIKVDPNDALAHHLLGRSLEALGAPDADAEYRLAVDLDPMPWRPPGASVDAVRRAAESHGAVLCDLPAIFRAASPGGAVGWELMADHVHPTLQGQALIARSIVGAMTELTAPVNVTSEAADALPEWEAYANRLGASVWDEYAAAHAMRTLGRIPFYEQSNPGFFDRFDARCREIEAEAPASIITQLTAWRDPATHKGGSRPIDGLVAQALFGQGAYAQAEPLFDAARRSVTPYGSWELQYTAFMLMCRGQLRGMLMEEDRRIAQAAIWKGRFLIRHGWSDSGSAERYTGEMLAMLGEHEEAVGVLLDGRDKQTEEGRVAIDGDLVRSLLALGRIDAAREIVEAGLRQDGRYAPYYLQMSAQVGSARGLK